ncbi:hypothetical protein BKP44_12745 [Formosa algae]|nr:hypothetical protein AST99_00840 [Formosa algae]PNW27518.1 hypothetical protein BKP44_12745 [Formosa algae]
MLEDTPITIAEDAKDFDWLLGEWKRLNEEDGKDTFEHWKKIDVSHYDGIGFTMHNGDTIQQEHMQFIKASEGWILKVKTPDEADWVTFNNIQHDDTSFTFENTEIEFPNLIKYWTEGAVAHAEVSNKEITIPFEFEKIK